mgnify:CR=1 FL=1
MALDPIEKKPLRRFHPGSQIMSIGSMGCNMRCPFCQNYEISMQEDAAFCVRLQPQSLWHRPAAEAEGQYRYRLYV